jgi:hypothetical protein
LAAGFQREDIVCWNEYFAQAMVVDAEQKPATAPRVGFGAPLPETFVPQALVRSS